MRGNLYEGDRFGRVVSERRRHRRHGVKVVQPDRRQGHRRAEGHRELGVGSEMGAPYQGAVWDGSTGDGG